MKECELRYDANKLKTQRNHYKMLVIVFEVDLSCCLDELPTLHNGYAREQKFDNLNY